MSRPVLLLISERFAPDLGGVARSATRTAQAVSRLGVEVHVLAWTRALPPGELATSELLPGKLATGEFAAGERTAGDLATGHRDGGTGAPVVLHRLGLFANWDLSMQHSLNVLEWLHTEFQFDGVWGHYIYPAGFLAVLFAESVGLPSTVSARGNDIDRVMFPPGDFARLLWTLQRATVVSAVSRELVARIDLLLGSGSDGVVLGNVVDTDVFQPAAKTADLATRREQYGILPGESVHGFCGELRHKKGLPFLLQALAQVQAERPARLLVIGDVRPREQSTISTFLLEHPELSDRIIVTGHLEEPAEVAACLQLCDVVLQPSVWDGLPNAILEAMACERIVIGSDAGGIPEAIEHGATGFVIPRSQLHRLGEGVCEVLDLSESERAEIGRRARDRVMQHFHAGVEADRLQQILRRLWPGILNESNRD